MDADSPSAPKARDHGAGVLGRSEDLRTLRAWRATAEAAGGVLDPVMPLRVGGDGPALFCVHPMVCLSWCYMAMLPYFDARYPLYGLQARGIRRPEPLPSSMQEMARDYADLIRMTQPSGPYHLLGWSLGANVAFAVAEEFERRGERIGLLAIMDLGLADLGTIGAEGEPWTIYNTVLAQFGYVPALTPHDPDPEARMLALVRNRPGLGLDDWPDQRLRALQRVIRNSVALVHSYRAGRVHCPLLFFSASRDELTLEEKLDSWRPFLDGPIEALELDCGHRQMLFAEPMARIGSALSERMARAATTVRTLVV
jgi:thioesterase domain-containing protein